MTSAATVPIHTQLRAARDLSGLTLEQVIARARLHCSVTSLSRKLAGTQVLTTSEAEQIAQALHVRVLRVA